MINISPAPLCAKLAPWLKTFGDQRRFIIARTERRENGKLDKIPTDPVTGHDLNHLDPARWMTPAEALLWLDGAPENYGIGVVLGDGLACIDIDHALNDGTWSPLCAELEARFAGAAIETSVSGTGRHILGSHTGLAEHRCKNKEHGIELYEDGRFIYLGGRDVSGDPLRDCTDAFTQTINQYFLPAPPVAAALIPEDGPVAAWSGPTDDAELIAVMMNLRPSAGAVFGSKATFSELWNADTDKLRVSFPSDQPHSAYDESSADLALANRLAWATGNDVERITRLMLQSKLYREKYERVDYLPRTIAKACAAQSTWYSKPTAVPATRTASMPTIGPDVLRMNRKMEFEATLQALGYMLGTQREAEIGFDEFRSVVMIAPAGTAEWRPLSDTDMVKLRERLAREQRFAPIGKELMRDALQLVADRYKFDSAITWLNGLQWDGVPRIERFLATYCGAADDEYTRAVGLYIWTGLAGRVLDPGCQLDMVVALQSPQGRKKSTGFQAMVPEPDFFTDGLSLQDDGDDFKRLIRGKLVIEIAELAGLSKADIDVVKRCITRRQEEWIEKYQTHPTRFKRRCMLFASTNRERFLPQDDTGQRRWVPVEIENLDPELIARDRDQLWAEGAVRWRLSGIAWRDAERLAAGRHKKYEQTDIWESAIAAWLDKPSALGGVPPSAQPLALSDVLLGALNLHVTQQDAKAEKRAATVMHQLGYESSTVKIEGKAHRRWVPKRQ